MARWWVQQFWCPRFGRHTQPLLHTTLLLSLLCPPVEPLPWDADTSSGPGQECARHLEDVCGVCAGDGSSCELVTGTLYHSVLPTGYYKLLDIPRGAQRIKIQETQKTRNYLALKTDSGESLINGAWVIDRPGRLFAAGTVLTYKRPNEIRTKAGESITAPGPTNQELHLYVIYQQPGISVYYEYVLPKDSPGYETSTLSGILPPENQGLGDDRIGIHPNLVPSDLVTPDPLSPYSWVAMTNTPCSATCGTGRRQVLFNCVERATQTTVPGDLCNHTPRPAPQEQDCQSQLCPAFWDLGEWSECSKTCGAGIQRRQVLCRQTRGRHGNSTVTMATALCEHAEMPETTALCQLKICSEWQIRSEWTQCPVPCGVGQQRREVVCVDALGDVVPDDDCNLHLRPAHRLNCDMGACSQSWFYSPWSDRCSADCGDGERSRSVVCLTNQTGSLPLDGCDDVKPEALITCNLGACTDRLEWYTGLWGQCSSECGKGRQSRGVVCVHHINGQLEVTSDTNCSHQPRPPDSQSCHLKSCGPQWYTTDWSSCSHSCGGGYRVREVRCLGDDLSPSYDCDFALTPARREECNTHICIPEMDGSCRDMYFNCELVLRAQLCVYSYYRMACCVSCSRTSHGYARRNGMQ
ncbi:thrombospondin type-1 domain-containing protein 4 isoform X2 [Electrophorus electricus]|uniref:thrombospondin type-1 domain-containing protein 4 isoform X2 n=1 Tax=Electrophorus electricus TaxID=8005 RepID=UPI0015CFF80C|nr:thrombospondin type-1 domain-containing protein 4 isoform X2 [Electrophorus electricus]